MKYFEEKYRKLVRASAVYDWIVTAPLAFPTLAGWHLSVLSSLHSYLGLAGEFPNFEPLHIFFINLMGSVVLVWSTLRVFRNEPTFGFYDAVARLLFSSWMVYYLAFENATHLLVLFVVPESLWGIVQFYGYWLYRKSRQGTQIHCQFAKWLLIKKQTV